MCGFAGVYSPKGHLQDSFIEILQSAGSAIRHRGPDDSGVWIDKNSGVGLVHRRLSIQDLSPAGAQPMVSPSGRYVIVFNGEIYNFTSLRDAFIKNGTIFSGHSDTETMLVAFDTWGVEPALDTFSGMFSFVLFDRQENLLVLARDRMGEKPLYYGWAGDYFVFASELKALSAFPFWQGDINRDALTLLLRHNFIPAPHSIYQNIYKLPQSTTVTINLDRIERGQLPQPVNYWDLKQYFRSDNPVPDNMNEAGSLLDAHLRDVIGEQMISDVPLGAFLSGGVDSSTVVAIMQQLSSVKVKTFSIGFDEQTFNEAEYAKAVANHLGTDHTELYVTAKDALAVIPNLPTIYDEPFADSSQIPTYLVAQLARKHVTVALSGDGGDELFCGYDRYFSTWREWEKHLSGGSGISALLFKSLGENFPRGLSKLIKHFMPSQRHLSEDEIAEKISRKLILMNASSCHEFYRQGISYWNNPEVLVHGAREPAYSMHDNAPVEVGSEICKQFMWQDLNCYLPDDILTKVDRAAMACSLETRIPLLDRRIVEFALQLPLGLNIKQGQGKQVLRNVLYRYVPRDLIEREKKGFAVPVGAWLRSELNDWAEALLEPARLDRDGFWDTALVRRKWQDHCNGRGDHSFSLWSVLMFQSWLEGRR